MGQPKVASVTWRDRIRRISQGFYEIMGQQIPRTRASEPMRACSHVKILNRDLRSTVIFLRKPKGISQTFRLRGRHWKNFMKSCSGKVFLVLDGHPAHKAKVVKHYTESLEGRLELHPLPKLSEGNPLKINRIAAL